MAAPAIEPAAANIESSGPLQRGRGVKGQYVYCITMPNPLPEIVASRGVKTPMDYTWKQFIELGVQVHTECEFDLGRCWNLHQQLPCFECSPSQASLNPQFLQQKTAILTRVVVGVVVVL